MKYADEPVFTSDNPRSEDPSAILKDMENGVPDAYYHSFVNRKQAIFFAIANAKKGDTVLIAGKSMRHIKSLAIKSMTLMMQRLQLTLF